MACIGRGFSLEFARPRHGRGAVGTLRCGGLYPDGCGLLWPRWFRDPHHPGRSGRDHGISAAIAYRRLDDVITVLADEAPGLHQALALREQMSVRSVYRAFRPCQCAAAGVHDVPTRMALRRARGSGGPRSRARSMPRR